MGQKINREQNFKMPIFIILLFFILYTRFVNIGWGLPHPMHPDERNMAVAIESLTSRDYFNPHFFAYGQFPLYLGYLLVIIFKLLLGVFSTPVNLLEAILSLRMISAIASIINVYILYQMIELIFNKNSKFKVFSLLILIFVPYAIQFAHFGTTESLLMLFYSLIIYYSFLLINKEINNKKFIILNSLFCGLAIATKVSSLIFLIIPIIAFLIKTKNEKLKTQIKVTKYIFLSLVFIISTLYISLIFSPHNLIHWKEFISTIKYESSVATGETTVFYTRQFVGSIPIWFHLTKIFPYALGCPIFFLFCLGFIFLSWKDSKINFLRFSFLIYFIPNAFLYAKWTRFIAPIFPISIVFSIIFLNRILKNFIFKAIIVFFLVIPGIFYLVIYQKLDVRHTASEWIYSNVAKNSVILSETANVVDIPFDQTNYKVISFNFYDLDENPNLQKELEGYLKKADYIFIPSRRIFMNHPQKKYPKLFNYYKKLFNGQLGFFQVAEFSSSLLFDEQAEETFSVFDHPVIRIYNRSKDEKNSIEL